MAPFAEPRQAGLVFPALTTPFAPPFTEALTAAGKVPPAAQITPPPPPPPGPVQSLTSLLASEPLAPLAVAMTAPVTLAALRITVPPAPPPPPPSPSAWVGSRLVGLIGDTPSAKRLPPPPAITAADRMIIPPPLPPGNPTPLFSCPLPPPPPKKILFTAGLNPYGAR